MEDVIQRFPNISRQIFENLDDKSLVLCREVCKAWKSCIDHGGLCKDREMFYWIRIIMKNLQYSDSEEKLLRILFRNNDLDIVKNLAEKTIEHCHSEDIPVLHIFVLLYIGLFFCLYGLFASDAVSEWAGWAVAASLYSAILL